MRKILIVDDEKELCESIKNVLLEKGFSCLVTYDGGSCLSLIKKEKPDLLLLDIMIPGLDGFEVCQRIKHDEKLADIPIIILTVLGDSKNRVAGFKAGADDYLTKPFDPDELVLRIEANLKIAEFSKALKKKIEESRENERLKAELLAHISYEVGRPLHAITKEVDLLISTEEGKLDEKQKERILLISRLSSEALSLLSKFMEIARIESGKEWIKIEEFLLDDALRLIEARCKDEAENKGLLFELEYPKVIIKTDKAHFIKILNELLLNAIKFTEKGKISLLIKENKENDTIICEVSDTGCGIKKEFLENIWYRDMWYNGKSGFILVKKLVGLLRGNIFVDSGSSGTRFTIVLPRMIDSPARRKEDKKF